MFLKIKNWWKQEKRTSKILSLSALLLVLFSLVLGGVIGTSYAAQTLPDKLTAGMGSLSSDDMFAVDLFPSLTGDDKILLTAPFIATDSTGKTYQMYCLEKDKEWYAGDDVILTKGQQLDAGYAYFAIHGYPAKSLTGNADYDFYLTQVAVWLYQDRVSGVSDSQNGVFTAIQKQAITQSSYYNSVIKPLVDGALNAHNTYQNVTPSFSISSSSFHLDSSLTYLETDYISVTSNVSFSSYSVALDMAGAQVIGENGSVVSGKISSGQKFKIRLPLANLSTSDLSLKVSVTTDYQDYEAYEYLPPSNYGDMQKAMASAYTVVTKQTSTSTNVTLPTGSITVQKVDGSTNQMLAGSRIEVRRAINNELVSSFTSTTSAKVISNLLPGKYNIVETGAPSGYLVQSDSTSVILDTSNLSVTSKIVNMPISVQIKKVDKDTKEALAGAVIKILDSNDSEVYRFTSTSGYVKIPNLKVGTYKAVEVSAPSGYLLDTTPKTFTITKDTTELSITMEDTKNRVEILKVDGETKEPISGARLRIVNTANSSVVDEWVSTTDAHVITGIPTGNYQVVEVSAPSGYVTSQTPYPFTVSNTQTDTISVSFPNTQSQIMISKVDEEGNLIAGAKLAIYDSTGKKIQEFTSKSTPTSIKKLAIGNYTLKELEAPSGYQLNPNPVSFQVTATTQNLQITMKNVKKVISFAKVDAETGSYVSGAKLRLLNDQDKVIAEWTSSNELHSVSGLANGTYYLEEVSAPVGYIRNTERIKVVVDDDTTTKTYTMKDQKITVKIAKVDSDTSLPVAGASLQLLDDNYEVVHAWITTTDYETFDDLTEGTYYVKEIQAPTGYVVNSEMEKITIDALHPNITVSFKNAKTIVKVGKVDSKTGKYIAGATLKLSSDDTSFKPVEFLSEDKPTVFRGLSSGTYTLEEISPPKGYVTSYSKITFELDNLGKTKNIALESQFVSISISNKKLVIDTHNLDGYEFQLLNSQGAVVDTYDVSKDGFTSKVLEDGTYTLVQTKVPKGMIVNGNPYTFTISDVDYSDIVYFANDFTKVRFDKLERIGGKQLAGGHFILRDSSRNVVAEWDSTTSGKVIERLAPGSYTLSEVKAPDGYQLNTSVLAFNVDEVGDVQVVTMFNDLKVEVPNTGENTLLYWFVGIIVVISGCSVGLYAYFRKQG